MDVGLFALVISIVQLRTLKVSSELKLKPHCTDLLEICCRLAGWPSLQQIYSKSVVSPANLYSKSTAFCHQRICLQHLDVLAYKKAALRCRHVCISMQATCFRLAVDKSVASPANLQQVSVMWFDLNSIFRFVRCLDGEENAAHRSRNDLHLSLTIYARLWNVS
jgi:hypothetical protein